MEKLNKHELMQKIWKKVYPHVPSEMIDDDFDKFPKDIDFDSKDIYLTSLKEKRRVNMEYILLFSYEDDGKRHYSFLIEPKRAFWKVLPTQEQFMAALNNWLINKENITRYRNIRYHKVDR